MATTRGLPLQGGLAPTAALDGAVVEIACDESGFSGSNLLDAATPVFTHASVDVSVDEARRLVARLSRDFRWSLDEFKSGHLLRTRRTDDALPWLLDELQGRAHVQVIDKEYFLVTRLVDLFLAEAGYAAGTRLSGELRAPARAVYGAGRVHRAEWRAFLGAFADLTRTKRRKRLDLGDPVALDRFFRARDALVAAGLPPDAGDVLQALDRARMAAVLARLAAGDTTVPPPLEPMLPALAETVLHWSAGGRQVLVIHDEQSALTAGRLRALQQVLAEAAAGPASPFAGLVVVDSRDDPRVQVADLLAGAARRADLVRSGGLLRDFVSPTSLTAPAQDSTR